MKKFLALLFILSVQSLFATDLRAETKEEKRVGKVRAEISKLGTGADAKIEVKLQDGTKVEGHIAEADQEQFVVSSNVNGERTAIALRTGKTSKR